MIEPIEKFFSAFDTIQRLILTLIKLGTKTI